MDQFLQVFPNITHLGIDIGITNCKISYQTDSLEIFNFILLSQYFLAKFNTLNFTDKKLTITGVGAIKYKTQINQLFPHLSETDELSAIVKSLTLEKVGNVEENEFPSLLINAGTGCSFVKIWKDSTTQQVQNQRISGSAVCGGTFHGLAQMVFKMYNMDINLNQTSNLTSICQNAAPSQNNFTLDHEQFWQKIHEILSQDPKNLGEPKFHDTIGSILGVDQPIFGLAPDLTAAFFNRFNPNVKNNPEDIIYELRETILANLLMNVSLIFQFPDFSPTVVSGNLTIYFTGGFFSLPQTEEIIRKYFDKVLDTEGKISLIFPENYKFAGSLGCLQMSKRDLVAEAL